LGDPAARHLRRTRVDRCLVEAMPILPDAERASILMNLVGCAFSDGALSGGEADERHLVGRVQRPFGICDERSLPALKPIRLWNGIEFFEIWAIPRNLRGLPRALIRPIVA
jgi:hypothetical protein